jgi:hypothetical protein
MKFKVGDIVLATKKTAGRASIKDFLAISPLGVGRVREITNKRGIIIGQLKGKPLSRFFFSEEDLILLRSIGEQ